MLELLKKCRVQQRVGHPVDYRRQWKLGRGEFKTGRNVEVTLLFLKIN
jgi:hypothetical protein